MKAFSKMKKVFELFNCDYGVFSHVYARFQIDVVISLFLLMGVIFVVAMAVIPRIKTQTNVPTTTVTIIPIVDVHILPVTLLLGVPLIPSNYSLFLSCLPYLSVLKKI